MSTSDGSTLDPIEQVIVLLDDIEATLAEVRAIARELKDGDTNEHVLRAHRALLDSSSRYAS